MYPSPSLSPLPSPETLLNATGTELRQALFALKRIFQVSDSITTESSGTEVVAKVTCIC